MRLEPHLPSEAHDTPHDLLIFSNTDMVLMSSLFIHWVHLFITTPVVGGISSSQCDWRLLRNGGLLVIVGVFAHFLQPFLSFGLATNKVDRRLFKKQFIQSIQSIQTSKQTNNSLNLEIRYDNVGILFFFYSLIGFYNEDHLCTAPEDQ